MKRIGHYAAIATLCALCLLCRAATAQESLLSFSGCLETTILWTQTSSVTVETISLNSAVGLGDWLASVDARFTDSEFDTLSFFAAGLLGNIQLNTSVAFNPSTLAFVSWQSGASFSLLDVAISDVLYITSPETSSYNLLSLSGTVEDIALQGTFKAGICPLSFLEARVCVSWLRAWCDTVLQACVQVSDAGFNSFTITMTGFSLFSDFLGVEGIFDAAFSYTTEGKTFSPTLRLQPDWEVCIDVEVLGEITFSSSLFRLDSAMVYGLVIECEWDDGTFFTFGQSFTEEKNSTITGKADYGGIFLVRGPLRACCDDNSSFEIAAYFRDASPSPGAPFGFGLLVASIDFRLIRSFGFTIDAEYPTDGEGWMIATTLRVFW